MRPASRTPPTSRRARPIEADATALFGQADVILKVTPPSKAEAEMLKEGSTIISFLYPLANLEAVKALSARKATAFAMELIPRISRAQPMDALSSQSNLGGYKAALIAAETLPRIFPLMMTAAGTISPARVFVVGAGVAGLQAIATARRLGALLEAYDVRPIVKEQIESLGAKFAQMPVEAKDAQDAGGYAKAQTEEFYKKQQKFLAERAQASDVVITTALIPGQRAPILISEDAVKGMRTGSVVVDLAAEQGGNCALTEPGKTVVKYGVTIIGPLNLPSTMAPQASQLYSRNITSFLLDDAEGRRPEHRHEGRRDPRAARDQRRRGRPPGDQDGASRGPRRNDARPRRPPVNLMIFLLATFLGLELVRHVSRLLHTPLMALTNAISSVSIVAALIVLSDPKNDLVLILVTVAVALVFTNIVSGFGITERILRLFRQRKEKQMNDTIVEYLYVVAILFFVISLKWLSEVKTSRYGNWMAASGMAVAIGGTLLAYQVQRIDLLIIAIVVGVIVGTPDSAEGPDDRRPPEDRGLARVRVARRRPGGDRRVLPEAPEHRRLHAHRPLRRDDTRIPDLHGQLHRLRQAPGPDPWEAVRLRRAELRQPGDARGRDRARRSTSSRTRPSRSSSRSWRASPSSSDSSS